MNTPNSAVPSLTLVITLPQQSAILFDMATRLASAGTVAGLSEQDILALSTAMSSVGINAEAGGTAMTQTMTAISKAVSAGGDDLETFAKIAGVSASEFADMWGNEPIDAISAFIGGLGKMNENGEDTISVLDELGLSGIRQSNMLRALALASDVLGDAVTTANLHGTKYCPLQRGKQKIRNDRKPDENTPKRAQ